MKNKNFAILQDMRRFKRLQRRFKHENSMAILAELTKLDDRIASKNIKWVRTYAA